MKNFSKKFTATSANVLSTEELNKVKGGLALTCEEKRGNFFGISYTTTVWSLKPNGSIWLTIQM